MEKKVALVAFVYFSCATLSYFIYRCYSFHAYQRNELKEERLPKGQKKAENVKDQERLLKVKPKKIELEKVEPEKAPENQKEVDINFIEDNVQIARQQEIHRKLEKNRRFAREQQEKEIAKGFILTESEIPKFIFNLKPLVGEEKKISQRNVGIASCEGNRNSMEDSEVAAQISFSVNHKSYQADVFAVLDGHGGVEASVFVKNQLAAYLKDALEKGKQATLTDADICFALKLCCIQLDADYLGKDGTTATIAFILANKVWIANVGDSRTILVKEDGATIQASEDAKPTILRYRNKIEKLGGYVIEFQYPGVARVNGRLAVAAAIGDKEIIGQTGQCCISPKPKITCYSLDEFKNGHLVLACDGLWDVATSNEVGEAIKQMADQGKPVKEMAERLVFSAINCKSNDNISVVVVKI